MTDTPGWAIPEGREASRAPGPPEGEGSIPGSAWGAQSPPQSRARSGWCQRGREETEPEIYTASPTPGTRALCDWLLGDTGTPSPPWLHSGREFPDMVSASVPFSPWHQSQSGGEGAMASGSQLVAGGGRAVTQEAWTGEGCEGEEEPGPLASLTATLG